VGAFALDEGGVEIAGDDRRLALDGPAANARWPRGVVFLGRALNAAMTSRGSDFDGRHWFSSVRPATHQREHQRHPHPGLHRRFSPSLEVDVALSR
jgi:hypothetical protein